MKNKLMTLISSISILTGLLASVAFAADTANSAREGIFNGHTYQLLDKSLTWTEAKKYCEKAGGHLVTITSEEEQQFIESLMENGTKNQYWIGLRTFGSPEWITEEKYEYSNWDIGEPNNQNKDYTDENYVHIYNAANPAVYGSQRFKWNDMFNDNTFPNEEHFFDLQYVGFICEWEYIHEIPENPDEILDISLDSDATALIISITSTTDSTLFTAFYDKDNALIAVKQSPVSGASSEQTVTIPVTENEADFYYAKCFLWGKDSAPLCPSRLFTKTDTDSWTYKKNAFYDSDKQHYVLTPDYSYWDVGAILFDTALYGDFAIELDYYAGSTNRALNGGDGIAVAFYSNPTNEPQSGGELGFTGCGGYGIELDTWTHDFDPQDTHIGLVNNDVRNHLASALLKSLEDEQWHHLKVVVKDLLCYAYVDGNLKITQTINKTEYGGLVISASTGDAQNLHAVKNIYISH